MNSYETYNPNIEQNDTEVDPGIKTWDDLQIDSSILRSIYSHGFETPSEIQKKAIPPIKKCLDCRKSHNK